MLSPVCFRVTKPFIMFQTTFGARISSASASAAHVCRRRIASREARSNSAVIATPARKYAIAYFASMPAPIAAPNTSDQRRSGARSSFTQASNASAQQSSSGTSVEMMRVENTTPGSNVKASADQNAVRAS